MADATSTGLTISSTSNLATGQKILVANAMMAFEPAAPDPDLISVERIPPGHEQWEVLVMARLADASALSEGTDLSVTQQLYANTVTITPTEHGILTSLSKRLLRRQGGQSILATSGQMMAASLRRRQAKDVVALYDGASKSSPGAGTALDVTHFRGSVAYLMTDNDTEYGPAQPPLIASLHIEQISDVILDITDTAPRGTTSGFTDDLLQRWWRGRDRLYGVEIFHSGAIVIDSGLDAKGAIFNKDFGKMVMATEAEATVDEDPGLRAEEHGLFQEWSEAEIADHWVVEIYSGAEATV